MDIFVPICPNPKCKKHVMETQSGHNRWFRDDGFFRTKKHGLVRRYMCQRCRKTFKMEYTDKTTRKKEIFDPEKAYQEFKAGTPMYQLIDKYNANEVFMRSEMFRLNKIDTAKSVRAKRIQIS